MMLKQVFTLIPNKSPIRFVTVSSFLPDVNLGFTSPNGEGCVFLGGVDGESVIGVHLRRLGVVCPGLCKGSKSKLLFSVAPQAISLTYFFFNEVV